ncbi:MAG: HARE-type protein [Patescibacteria group bacterium]|nr:HARE-type protein [Patescibacteria group bacterium]
MINNVEKNNTFQKSRAKERPEFLALADSLMSGLSERSREIMAKRYGLASGKGETLEHIGARYSITRERVRQIIADALKNISQKMEESDFKKAEEKIIFTIEENDGIMKESDIISLLNTDGPSEANAIKFFAGCSKKIYFAGEKGEIEKSWVVSKDILESVREAGVKARAVLEKAKRPMTDAEISGGVGKETDLSEKKIFHFLKVLSKIKRNQFGKWGMRDWTEISPKGTREKIYVVLKETKKPLHFTEIASFIDKYKLGKRKAHPQTVHNELIKDDRFVLIGRGIYALREWGYSEGTIKDVLKDILAKSKEPLDREEILARVFKIRKVKKTTVMINLNNARVFERRGEGYTIKR